jgi:hypothetical protein
MPTTNNNWPTPVATDLVKDGWEAIKDLGDAIDTTLGVYADPGLVLLNTTSFSAVASQSVNDVFSATYDNYRIVLTTIAAAAEQSIGFRLRVGGTDTTSSNYIYAEQVLGANGTSYNQVSTGDTKIVVGRTGVNGMGSIIIDVAQPFLAQRTTTNHLSAGDGTTTLFGGRGAGSISLTTSYTGFTFFPGGSTVTGSVSVYGYNK